MSQEKDLRCVLVDCCDDDIINTIGEDFTISRIKEGITKIISFDEGSGCQSCGYGHSCSSVFIVEDQYKVELDYWGGCLSYDRRVSIRISLDNKELVNDVNDVYQLIDKITNFGTLLEIKQYIKEKLAQWFSYILTYVKI